MTFHFNIKRKVALWYTVGLQLCILQLKAQTYLNPNTVSTPLSAGEYYHNTQIILNPGFHFTASSGNSLHLYVTGTNCVPATTAISQSQNYVLTTIPRIKGYNPSNTTYTICEVMKTVQYLDGIGRPLQTVTVKGNADATKDIIQPFGYDPYGREAIKYLPYVATDDNSGSYRSDALSGSSGYTNSGQRAYYLNTTEASGVVNIGTGQVPYAETRFEASPLNRQVEQGAPGLNWQIAGGHTSTSEYHLNTSTDAIRFWVIGISGGASYTTTYSANTLYKSIAIDPNGHSATKFTDLEGHLICKKVQSGTGTEITTDYIYDDLGNLRYVIPPLPSADAVNPSVSLPSSFSETDNAFLNFFYGYHYDGRKRVIAKKIPGKAWVYSVYNAINQPILTQDALQAANHIWLFTKYDGNGRIVQTGEYASTASASTLQNSSDSFTGTLWEKHTGSASNYGYSHDSYPDITTSGSNKVLTTTYYDNYDVLNNTAVNPNSGVFTAPSTLIDTLAQSPRGLPTAAIVNVLGTTSYLFSVTYYDTQGRSVKTIKQFYQGGATAYNKYDSEETQYSFNSDIVQSTRKHYPASSTVQLTAVTSHSYDHLNRKTYLRQQYVTPSATGPVVTLAKYEYNDLGQVKTKHLHSTQVGLPLASSFLQHIDYRYTARGWLSRINTPSNLTDENYSSLFDVFAEQLDYDTPNSSYSGTAQYNGNISTLSWQTKVPSTLSMTQEVKGYSYVYDALNRLTNASSKATTTGNGQQDEALTYDALGNILSLSRRNTASSYLNNLTYSYTAAGVRGSRLNGVTDNGTVTESYNSSYTYDNNGNAYSDAKKTISSIIYNSLNLPAVVSLSGKTINYWYDANGVKLERVTKVGATVVDDRSYDDGIEYLGSTIDLIQTEEGRALPSSGAYIFQYNALDHLGDIRALFGDANNNGVLSADEISQVSDYYAFGREITPLNASTPQRYKYNGKELQDDLNQYDYGARFYDPLIGRWNGLDPLAEKYDWASPYKYAGNNPVNVTDPNGMIEVQDSYGGNVSVSSNSHYSASGDYASEGGTYGSEGAFRNAQPKVADAFFQGQADANAESNNNGPPTKKPIQKGYWATFYDNLANRNMMGEVTSQWNRWIDHPDEFFTDGATGLGQLTYKAGSLLYGPTWVNMYHNAVNYIKAPPEQKALLDANDLSSSFVGFATYAPLGFSTGIRGNAILNSGLTFEEYKATQGGTQTLAKIETASGIQRISTEFHHAIITQRLQKSFNLPNWLVNNKINVWKLNTVQHSLIDPYRYNFLRAGFKPQISWVGNNYNWFTKF
jgi:RHS repeat-associated protein